MRPSVVNLFRPYQRSNHNSFTVVACSFIDLVVDFTIQQQSLLFYHRLQLPCSTSPTFYLLVNFKYTISSLYFNQIRETFEFCVRGWKTLYVLLIWLTGMMQTMTSDHQSGEHRTCWAPWLFRCMGPCDHWWSVFLGPTCESQLSHSLIVEIFHVPSFRSCCRYKIQSSNLILKSWSTPHFSGHWWTQSKAGAWVVLVRRAKSGFSLQIAKSEQKKILLTDGIIPNTPEPRVALFVSRTRFIYERVFLGSEILPVLMGGYALQRLLSWVVLWVMWGVLNEVMIEELR